MRKKINQMEILQKKGARSTYSLRGIGIKNWSAVRGSVDRSIRELWMAHTFSSKMFLKIDVRKIQSNSDRRETENESGGGMQGYLLRADIIYSSM
jgi:hypothetical protein